MPRMVGGLVSPASGDLLATPNRESAASGSPPPHLGNSPLSWTETPETPLQSLITEETQIVEGTKYVNGSPPS